MAYRYKWKPNKSQRREFAINMQDPEFAQSYLERKKERFWNSSYKPTKEQYEFCMEYYDVFETPQEKDAANFVISAYNCSESVHHDFIHIVNEKRRNRIKVLNTSMII